MNLRTIILGLVAIAIVTNAGCGANRKSKSSHGQKPHTTQPLPHDAPPREPGY